MGDPRSRRTPKPPEAPGPGVLIKECPTMSFAKNRAVRQIAVAQRYENGEH
jgi:hypothetical protein